MMQMIKNSVKRILPERVVASARRAFWPDRQFPSPPSYNSDGLITWHNCDFKNDPRFRKAYMAGERTKSWKGADIHWRAYVACWAADQVRQLEGDFVECGVNRGGLARAVVEYVDFKHVNRTFYLLDTFRGLSEKYISEEERKRGFTPTMGGYYEECYDDVVETFREFSNVSIIRGTVPDTLSQVRATKVCYLSIDMNCAEPEIAAIDFFWAKLVPGAFVVLDDYGWQGHILQKQAFDQFAERQGVHVLSLPTGQGLLVKP
jgi:O-methyltransferase